MSSFTFEGADTSASECEGSVDIISMINGGEPILCETKAGLAESVSADQKHVEDDVNREIEALKAEHTNLALIRLRSENELKEIKKAEKQLLERLDKLQR